MKRMITTMFFAHVTSLKRAPPIIIHLARNAEKGGGVLMSVTLPNLNHSFIFPVPDFLVFHTPLISGHLQTVEILTSHYRPPKDFDFT